MEREAKILRKNKNFKQSNKKEMEIYEIGVHFLLRKENGVQENWNLTQKDYFASSAEARAAAKRLKNLLRELGKQLIWVSSPSGGEVWTNDPEAYKKKFPYDFETRDIRVYVLD